MYRLESRIFIFRKRWVGWSYYEWIWWIHRL